MAAAAPRGHDAGRSCSFGSDAGELAARARSLGLEARARSLEELRAVGFERSVGSLGLSLRGSRLQVRLLAERGNGGEREDEGEDGEEGAAARDGPVAAGLTLTQAVFIFSILPCTKFGGS